MHTPPSQEELDRKLLTVVSVGDVQEARALIRRGASPQARLDNGKTALHLVMQLKDYGGFSDTGRELLGLFLNKGLDINVQDDAGVTPLHQAALDETYSSAKNKIEDLLNFGADIGVRDRQGQSPLHYAAARRGKTRGDAFKILLENSRDANPQDEMGRTPLHVAAAHGDAEVIKMLLLAGGDLLLETDKGKHAWDYAEDCGHDYLAQTLKAEGQKQRTAMEKKPAADDPWKLLSPEKVSHVSVEGRIGYRLTEIFNFSARTYTQIAHNLQTRHEGIAVKTFDDFSDRTLLERAHDHLTRLGGDADRSLIYHRSIDKPRKPPQLK